MKTLQTLSALTVFGSLLSLTSCQPKATDEDAAEATSPGKQLVMESIEAHGGIDQWRSNGLFKFRWTYHMTDRGAVVDSVQTVDPNNFAALHTVPNTETSFGRTKDGSYWIQPADAQFTPPVQFWTLTPVYFMGIPFVFDDDQITFELLDEPKAFQGKDYTQVKLSYADTAGESPDDYYVLLIDPDSKVTRGAYYTVTNPLLYKGGPLTEKFISLDDLQEVGGLQVAGGHKTYTMTDGVIGEQMRYTDVSEVAFLPRDSVDFAAPEGARILDPVQ